MMTVVLTEVVDPAGLALLQARSDLRIVIAPADLPGALGDAQAIGVRTVKLDPGLLEQAPRLRVVAKHGIGTDNIAVDHLSRRGIPVAIAAGANTASVVEHTMMLMLAAARRLVAFDRAVRDGDWDSRRVHTAELAGRTVLIVGYGRIGRGVAAACRAFGMKVMAFDPDPSPTEPGTRRVDDLDTALAEADVLTLHLPALAATRGLIDRARIGRLRPGAIVVNCARGGIVDEAALAEALREGQVAAAGFDVLADEPPRPDNPLLHAPNVVLTPHNAALTAEAARAMAVGMANNILDVLDGRLDPAVVVNFDEINKT